MRSEDGKIVFFFLISLKKILQQSDDVCKVWQIELGCEILMINQNSISYLILFTWISTFEICQWILHKKICLHVHSMDAKKIFLIYFLIINFIAVFISFAVAEHDISSLMPLWSCLNVKPNHMRYVVQRFDHHRTNNIDIHFTSFIFLAPLRMSTSLNVKPRNINVGNAVYLIISFIDYKLMKMIIIFTYVIRVSIYLLHLSFISDHLSEQVLYNYTYLLTILIT